MEANPDFYGLAPHPLDDLQALAVSNHISNMIDWQRVKEGLQREDGLARDVTIRVAAPILSTSSLFPILSPAFSILHRERLLRQVAQRAGDPFAEDQAAGRAAAPHDAVVGLYDIDCFMTMSVADFLEIIVQLRCLQSFDW